SGVILLERNDRLSFSASIQPQPPGNDPNFTRPSTAAYRAAVDLERPLDLGKFVCDNQTPYLLDLLVFPWKPSNVQSPRHFRFMSVPPCPSRQVKSYDVIESDPSTYF